MLWFDVGIKRYTTVTYTPWIVKRLWFDVGIKRYTTLCPQAPASVWLWFDVGIKRYTTLQAHNVKVASCGLM